MQHCNFLVVLAMPQHFFFHFYSNSLFSREITFTCIFFHEILYAVNRDENHKHTDNSQTFRFTKTQNHFNKLFHKQVNIHEQWAYLRKIRYFIKFIREEKSTISKTNSRWILGETF